VCEKILIVDDEMYILHVLAMKLRNAGYEVHTAGDGEEALKLCLVERPDLVITDFQMPYLNGLELCEAYRREAGRAVPAVLITAREFDIDPEQMASIGVEAIIAKPFSPREVVRTVRRLLEGREAADGTNRGNEERQAIGE
jgi:DNA-binding response OmpR family regulator